MVMWILNSENGEPQVRTWGNGTDTGRGEYKKKEEPQRSLFKQSAKLGAKVVDNYYWPVQDIT